MKKINIMLPYIAFLLVIVLIAFPFYWLGVSSFKFEGELLKQIPTFIPSIFTLSNYKRLFAETNFPINIINSLYVSLGTVGLTVFLAVFAAYSIYRCKFRETERALFFVAMIFIYAFPRIVILFPLYQIISKFGLIDKLISLILINSVFSIPFAVWILRAFFREIPIEIDEAATIDGVTRFGVIFRIYVPLAAPGIIAAGIFAFIGAWTEFQFSSIIIVSQSKRVLSMALSDLITQYRIDWGGANAGSIITSLGPIMFFLATGRYFVKGLTAGSVK